jgi:transposase
MQGELTMTYRELDRLTIVKQVVSGNLTQKEAAELLKVTERQVRRLKRRHQLEGPSGLISKRRGQPSNRKLSVETRAKALNLIREHFYDYGPTLAAEKLAEYFKVTISKETTRQWMMAAGVWQVHTRKYTPCVKGVQALVN